MKNLSFLMGGIVFLAVLAASMGLTTPSSAAADRYTVNQAGLVSIDSAEAYEAYKLFDQALYRTRCAAFALTSGFGGPGNRYFAPSADTPLLFAAVAPLALNIVQRRRAENRQA